MAQDPTKVARGLIEAYNAGEWNRLKAAFASGAVYTEMGTQRRFRGVGRIVGVFQAWKQAIPDSKGTVTHSLARGNTVVLEVVWKGTHTGPLAGPSGAIPPSGKRISVPAAQVITFEGGKIRQLRQYFDLLTLLEEIGAAAPPKEAGGA